jgi:hypothetical protein
MKRILNVLTWLLVSSALMGQTDYLKYPDYDTVITKFFENYSIVSVNSNSRLRFEKRPAGWYVTVIDYSAEPKTIKDELLWDRKDNKFKELDFEKISIVGENQASLDQYKNDYLKYLYRTCPYYGYPAWDWDVIREFKDANNLPDSVLYGLGRVYSSFAGNLLNNNSGLADLRYQFTLPQGKNCLTSEQLEKYRYYRHLAIEKYKKLAELNPNYETIVGRIGTSVSNEHITSFLDLRIYQNEAEAQKELVDGLYNDFYLAVARNYLSSCAPNAILFTNGDNDTYPLLYIQSKYHFRTDVLVVNINLLQTERYINSLREQILDAEGLPVSLTPEAIGGKKREVIVLENSDENPGELSNMINFVKNDEHKKSYGGIDYYYMPAKTFRLNQAEKIVEWSIDKNYLLLNQLIILDILATNNWERPVYFAVSIGSDQYLGLDDYLKLEGLAYRLSSTKKDSTDSQLGSVNSEVMYTNLMKIFDWNGLYNISSDEKLFCLNYKDNFQRLAGALIKENKPDSAKSVLNKCIEILPNEKLPFDYIMIYLIEEYYKIREFEKGNQITRQLIYNLQNNIDNYNNLTAQQRSDYRAAVMGKIKELANEYDQKEIITLLDN